MDRLKRLQKELRALRKELSTVFQELLRQGPILPGCVYVNRRRCGRLTCHCIHGRLHETELLSYRGGAQLMTVVPRNETELEKFRKLTEPYRKFRKARARLRKIHRKMLEVINQIEEIRVKKGKARFLELRPDLDTQEI